ncbi:MAG: replication initiator [Streptosporangiaceae bacterium]
MTQAGKRPGTRAQRLAMPLARNVVKDVAAEHGACIRPIQLRRTDVTTGAVEQVLVPCGHTLASVCPPCAERAKTLRAAQCREGWHLEDEPLIDPDPPTGDQQTRIVDRAEAQADRDALAAEGLDTTDLDERIGELDEEITEAGMRGKVLPAKPRRHRSTRRRRDAAALPHRKVSNRTVGKTYTAPDGKVFRPSMFITLTCPSYGRVGEDGAPANPESYDYRRAARDALHFAALFDRFVQNLRRFCGYDLQYFAAIEPQRRLAPHVHIAIRGTVSRAELREVLAATYHQVWWPSTQTVKYDGDHLPVWDEAATTYLDSGTGEVLPTWDEALGAIGDQDEPWHVVRFGQKFDAQGVLAGSRGASRCIGYLTKYLTKHVGDCHQASTEDHAAHADRFAATLRYEPCSPTCANWLRYGIQPKHARPGLVPGRCKGKAHRREYLGYGGRRVLVSRKWSCKTLADHRGDRKAWLTEMLAIPATDPTRYTWEMVKPGDLDHMPNGQRLLHVVADRIQWQTALEQARRRAAMPTDPELSATGTAA